MRRQDHVVQLEQRIVERERLDLEDVEARRRRSGDRGAPPSAPLIDQLAPADVDEVGRRLHQRQLRRDRSARGSRRSAGSAG